MGDDSSVGLCQYRVTVADSVKSQPKEAAHRQAGPVRPLRRMAILLCFLAIFLEPGPLRAQSLLLGPAARRVKAKIELDPRLPTGSIRKDSLAQRVSGVRACSSVLPICVAASKADAHRLASTLEVALAELEVAYRRLVYGARLPAPIALSVPGHGSVAVTWEIGDEPAALSVSLVPAVVPVFQSAAVVCRSGVATEGARHVERDAFLCIGEAIAARLDPAESPRSRRAYAEALWWELGRPGEADLLELSRVNAHPELAAVGREELADAASTALLFEYLERALGTEAPFGFVTGLFALSGQPTDRDAARFRNEPDWLDVLRATLNDEQTELAHRLNAFAAARVQLGATEGPLASLAWTGDYARVTPDWNLRATTLPRRVASKSPIAPLGLIAVRVELDVPTPNLSLAVRVEWEAPVPFAWTVVKLDAHEREIGRLDFAFEPRVTSAEKRIVALDETRSLLILGTNFGGIDATHLLDPDHSPFEPHGCTVYVVKL